jgi:hypothetical protein
MTQCPKCLVWYFDLTHECKTVPLQQCGICKQFLTGTGAHYCYPTQQQYQQYQQSEFDKYQLWTLIPILERITIALENLASSTKETNRLLYLIHKKGE